MSDRCQENVIEWLNGDKEAVCTFSQKKFKHRVRRMAETHPELAKITAENADGSIMARIPLSAVHLTIYGSKTTQNEALEENIDESEED